MLQLSDLPKLEKEFQVQVDEVAGSNPTTPTIYRLKLSVSPAGNYQVTITATN